MKKTPSDDDNWKPGPVVPRFPRQRKPSDSKPSDTKPKGND